MNPHYHFPYFSDNPRIRLAIQIVIFIVAFLLGWLTVSLVSGQTIDPRSATVQSSEEIVEEMFRRFEEDPRYRFESRPAREIVTDPIYTSALVEPSDLTPTLEGGQPVGGQSDTVDTPPVQLADSRIFRCYDSEGIRELDGTPMEVFQMRVPADWRSRCSVHWRVRGLPSDRIRVTDLRQPAEIRARIDSPDGRIAIEFYPEVWFSDDRSGRIDRQAVRSSHPRRHPVMSAEDYIVEHVVPRQRGVRGARVVHHETLPSLARLYDAQFQLFNQTARAAISTEEADAAGTFGLRAESIDHDAAVVTVEYHKGTTAQRETFVVVLRRVPMNDRTLWWADTALSVRAPRDQFDATEPQVAATLRSFRMNPRWLARYVRIIAPNLQKVKSIDLLARQIAAALAANREKINAALVRSIYPSTDR